jgi:hypothetical protein
VSKAEKIAASALALTARSWCTTGVRHREKRGAVLQKNKKNGALELI